MTQASASPTSPTGEAEPATEFVLLTERAPLRHRVPRYGSLLVDRALLGQALSSSGTFPAETVPETTDVQRGPRFAEPLVLPMARSTSKGFIRTGQWEGTVVERFDTYFVAQVIDLMEDETAVVEFEMSELSRSDLDLCEPGALFYWSIGYDIRETGQRSRSSTLVFRRLGRH